MDRLCIRIISAFSRSLPLPIPLRFIRSSRRSVICLPLPNSTVAFLYSFVARLYSGFTSSILRLSVCSFLLHKVIIVKVGVLSPYPYPSLTLYRLVDSLYTIFQVVRHVEKDGKLLRKVLEYYQKQERSFNEMEKFVSHTRCPNRGFRWIIGHGRQVEHGVETAWRKASGVRLGYAQYKFALGLQKAGFWPGS